MYIIRKKIKFEMGHRLTGAYTKLCKNSHGHSFELELFFRSDKLDEDGFIIDFKLIKDKLKDYIDKWDHCFVISSQMDKEYIDFEKKYNDKIEVVDFNPTAENMVKNMYDYIKIQFPCLWKVRLHETDTGYAEYYEDEKCCKG
jgi:6-pyruvoyltetrahydropterin/6-carboxytetrahydropterin synthase